MSDNARDWRPRSGHYLVPFDDSTLQPARHPIEQAGERKHHDDDDPDHDAGLPVIESPHAERS